MKFLKLLISLASLAICNAAAFCQVNVQFPLPTITGNIKDGAPIPGSFPFYKQTPTYQTIGKITYATNPSCQLSVVTLKYGKKKADGTHVAFLLAGNNPVVFNASFANNQGESNLNILVFDYSHPNGLGFNFGIYPIQSGEVYSVEVELTLMVPVAGEMVPVPVKTSKHIDK